MERIDHTLKENLEFLGCTDNLSLNKLDRLFAKNKKTIVAERLPLSKIKIENKNIVINRSTIAIEAIKKLIHENDLKVGDYYEQFVYCLIKSKVDFVVKVDETNDYLTADFVIPVPMDINSIMKLAESLSLNYHISEKLKTSQLLYVPIIEVKRSPNYYDKAINQYFSTKNRLGKNRKYVLLYIANTYESNHSLNEDFEIYIHLGTEAIQALYNEYIVKLHETNGSIESFFTELISLIRTNFEKNAGAFDIKIQTLNTEIDNLKIENNTLKTQITENKNNNQIELDKINAKFQKYEDMLENQSKKEEGKKPGEENFKLIEKPEFETKRISDSKLSVKGLVKKKSCGCSIL